jgi:hypothetical protein
VGVRAIKVVIGIRVPEVGALLLPAKPGIALEDVRREQLLL